MIPSLDDDDEEDGGGAAHDRRDAEAEDAIPAGLRLGDACVWGADRVKNELKVHDLPRRRRSSSHEAAIAVHEGGAFPRRVYFPLLAVLLRAWLATNAEDDGDGAAVERVVLLVSGHGTPSARRRRRRPSPTGEKKKNSWRIKKVRRGAPVVRE